MVDAVMRRIEQEEATEAEARRKRQRDTQAEIAAFIEQQQELKKRCGVLPQGRVCSSLSR